jgi:ribonuclease E
VRQLRLRDIGGIIVVDFIDMVLESNRDLVLRRLTECLGRDRTRHQVAEVTSLGLVQMTRKRVGTGLLEAFSTTCEHCRGRGVLVSTTPVHAHTQAPPANGNNGNNGNNNSGSQNSGGGGRRTRHRGGQDKEPAAEPVQEPQRQPEPEPVATVQPEPAPEPAPEPVVAAEPAPVVAVEPAEPEVPVQQAAEPEVGTPEPVAEARPAEGAEPELAWTNGHQPMATQGTGTKPPTAMAVANPPRPTRRRAASRPAGPPAGQSGQ